MLVEGDFTWHEARIDSISRGGRLAVLNSEEKFNKAYEYIFW